MATDISLAPQTESLWKTEVNLIPPFILALCVSTLRMGAQELFRPDNCLEGRISVVEFTALKLSFSSATALLLAMLSESHPSWWAALMEESPDGILLMLLGAVFVLIFQLNLTWLAGLSSVATVGIIGGVKVIPQWILNGCFHLEAAGKASHNPQTLSQDDAKDCERLKRHIKED